MPQTISVSFDCGGLESILAELKLRPEATRAVSQLMREGRHRELFNLRSTVEHGHVFLKFEPTQLLHLILSAADC